MTDTVSADPVHAFISDTVSQNDVVLFMKGTPDQPRCGFSSLAVQILDHVGAPFVGVTGASSPPRARSVSRSSRDDGARFAGVDGGDAANENMNDFSSRSPATRDAHGSGRVASVARCGSRES